MQPRLPRNFRSAPATIRGRVEFGPMGTHPPPPAPSLCSAQDRSVPASHLIVLPLDAAGDRADSSIPARNLLLTRPGEKPVFVALSVGKDCVVLRNDFPDLTASR